MAAPLAAVAVGVGVFSALAPVPASAADCTYQPRPSIDWSDCNRQNLMLGGANLAEANLSHADFGLTDLSDSTLTSANFSEAKLVRASLAGANADAADFSKVEGYRTNFSAMSAEKASFQSAELQRANFAGATLSNADFEKAELGRASFDGARLGGNSFVFANLARADFSRADIAGPLDFSNAYLFLTRIEGADLSAATGLAQTQIDIACGNAETKLPQGLSRPEKWPCAQE
ncbi:pentapeptide repeat-containing protein [Aurantimonas sp. 22II-16-19i]|uniref:pentapeptide repeat-containing protein n=1 Tax=Aurantimonas sp. 22II-16-19i TaxID=1317114 RepID=UPI0009FA6784|nr:pentapeptide repeat-containing protein [Aurantimonas sp. 22II-16-19i]